ncbi:unnamed protein product [Lota lota]
MSTEVRTNARDIDMLDVGEISDAEDIVMVLKPLKTATTVVCDEKEPTQKITEGEKWDGSALLFEPGREHEEFRYADIQSRAIGAMTFQMHKTQALIEHHEPSEETQELSQYSAVDISVKIIPFIPLTDK